MVVKKIYRSDKDTTVDRYYKKGRKYYRDGRKVARYGGYARGAYQGYKRVSPYVGTAARVGGRVGGKAIVKVVPGGARLVGAASKLGPIAGAAGPVAVVVAAGVAMGAMAEHLGWRTYIENEMRSVERFFGRNISAKAPPPRW